jgi:aminocarboxymuconate-semialdehyde decarboxylase
VTTSTEPTSCVDVHAHILPRELLTEVATGRTAFPHVTVTPHESTYVMSFNGGKPTRPVAAGLTDPANRASWLAEHRIGTQVVGGWLDAFGYELPAAEGADWAVALTESIAAAAHGDDRLIALGTVPLQDPARAAEVLRSQRTAGLPGVMIGTRAGARELDDPAYTPFWEAADETDAVVFLHPGFGAASERYRDFGLLNGLARLEDSTVTLARLLYAGIPARYPRARIVVAHGGAAVPAVLGRLARNHAITAGTADPVESFAHLYFDSVVFDPETLRFLVAKAGADRVLLGSDYPFPIGDLAPRDVVEHAGLADADRARIIGGTARQLFPERAGVS